MGMILFSLKWWMGCYLVLCIAFKAVSVSDRGASHFHKEYLLLEHNSPCGSY